MATPELVRRVVAQPDKQHASINATRASMSGKDKRPLLSRRIGRQDAALAFHVLALAYYTRVWAWHCTPAAALLPGSSGFGWFFRYLTFYSFSLQLLQLALCVVAGVAQDPKARDRLSRAADDLSCALFGLAHAVTLLYFAIHSATGDAVEGGHIERPPWLGISVHVGNTLCAWLDLALASPRSFSGRSQSLSMAIVLAYCLWILLCRQVEGAFPYPFLNKLPFPTGYLCTVAAGVLIFWAAFQAGRAISRVFMRWKQ